MIGVQVNIPKRVHKFTRLQITHLCHHHREQCVGRYIEWHTEESIRRTLIQLAIELAVIDVKLKQAVARWQSHIIDKTRVPRRDYMTT